MSDDELKVMGFSPHPRMACEWWLEMGQDRFVSVDKWRTVEVHSGQSFVTMYGVKSVTDLRELIRLMGCRNE